MCSCTNLYYDAACLAMTMCTVNSTTLQWLNPCRSWEVFDPIMVAFTDSVNATNE